MTRANPAVTPGFRAQLEADLKLAESCSSLSQLKGLAKRYQLQLRPNSSFFNVQDKLKKHLVSLNGTSPNYHSAQVEDEPQGSAAAAFSPITSLKNPLYLDDGERSPIPAHRLSYSAVLSPAGPKGMSKLSVLGSVIKPKSPLTKAASVMQEASPLVGEAAGVTQSAAESNQPDLDSLISAAVQQRLASEQPYAEQASRIRELEQRVAGFEQERARVESLFAAFESMRVDLSGLRSDVGRLQQQQRQCQATALSATQSTASLQGAVDRLQDQAAHADKLQEEVGLLRSKQQRLAEQQELEECQRAVVLKAPADQKMPACEPAVVEGWLKQQLGQQPQGKALTVLRVHRLQRQGQGGAPGRTTTYKVVLGDSAQRDSVLRSKASALRGTPYTIDVCLTRQQLVSKRVLMPVAKRAAQHGQQVRWKYDRLYIDGKEYLGSVSQPGSRQQQQGAGQPASKTHTTATTPPVPASPPELEEGEWQVASTRKRRQQRQRRRQQQARDNPAGVDSRLPSPAASPKAVRNNGRASGGSAATTTRPPSPANKVSKGAKGPSSGAAAKGPSKQTQRSYADAAAKGAAQGKENSGSRSSSSGAAKGASRVPLAPLAQPTNAEGAQHSGGSQHGQQPRQPSSTPTSPPRA